MINGGIIKNCGIANYIINVDVPNQTLDYYLKKMLPIEDFAKQQNIYFACKALNYRCSKDKWDGDRPLAVYVDWKLNKNNILTGILVYDSPLSVKGNVIGKNLRIILEALHINKDNFMSLEKYLHPDIKKI